MAGIAIGVDPAAGGAPTGRKDGCQRGLAGRAVNHPTTGGAGAVEPLGKTEQFQHPVHHQRLYLSAGGAGHPAHALHAQARCGQLTQDRWVTGVGGKVGKKVRVLFRGGLVRRGHGKQGGRCGRIR